MHSAAEILDEFGIPHEDQIISAHRTPKDWKNMQSMQKKMDSK